jgi:pimeloyl-ACP methyl ester carboxylesterase
MDGSYRVLFRDKIRVCRQPACLIARENEITRPRRSTQDYDMKYQDEDDYDIVIETPEIALEMSTVKKWEIGSLCQVLDEDSDPSDGSMWFVGRVSRIIKSMGTTWLRVQWKDTFIWGPQHIMKFDYFKEKSPLIKPLEGDVCFKLLGRNTEHVQLSSPMLSTRYFQFQWLTTDSKLRIPSFFFTPYSGRASFTLLFSHGNGCDLGIMRDLWYQLCNNLDVNIIGYDYYGYGVSVGDCTVRQTLIDVRTVWRYVTEKLSIPSEEVILYGQSLGSGPTSYLARYLTDNMISFGGIILHSGFLSSFRIIEPCESSFWFDIYQNIDKLQGISVPTLILHGQQDQIVPCSHGKVLEETLKRQLPSKEEQQMIWLSIFPRAGHNDVEITCRQEYIDKIADFLAMCLERKNRGRTSTYLL